MASDWAKQFPVVRVPQAATPKPVTFVYPYYQCHRFFAHQLAVWRAYPPDLRAHLSVIVADDGSPTPATLPTVEARPFPMRLFRIDIDLPWNWLAARNIGAHYAPEGWMVLTDMDHVVPAETARALVHGQHDPSTIYAFTRQEHTGGPVQPHSASFFLTKALFWQIGGYDETLSGRYGTDGDFRKRAFQVAPCEVLTERLIRHEYVDDSSTTQYARKRPEDATAVQRLIAERRPGWRPRVLSFPFREVV